MSNILLTGGHGATTGIAVIEEIKKQYPKATISWIGTTSTVPGTSTTSLEYKIYPKLGVNYFSIHAGKLQTKFTKYTIPLLFLIPIGFIEALWLIMKIKPSVILSFGGYSSFPVVLAGWIFRIPVILHEQTVTAGRASMTSAFFANKVCLSREESLKYFPKNKCVITGNPLRSEILNIKPKNNAGNKKTLLIMGGSRGSEFINEEITKIRESLLTKYKLIHITGERDFEKYNQFASNNYQVEPFVSPEKMVDLYIESDVVVSRSGANTVSELVFLKRPSILIPLPKTFLDEQFKNAKYAERMGIARVLLESEVNPKSLTEAIDKTFADWEAIVQKSQEYKSMDLNAASNVVALISEFI